MNFLEVSGLIFWFCIAFVIVFVVVCIAESKDSPVIEDEKMTYGKTKKENNET